MEINEEHLAQFPFGDKVADEGVARWALSKGIALARGMNLTHEDGRDAAAEVLAALHTGSIPPRTDCRFSLLVLGALKNKLIDILRKRSTLPDPKMLSAHLEGLRASNCSSASPDEVLSAQELEEILRSCVRDLPPQQRSAIRLYLEGVSAKEAAARGLFPSQGAFRASLYRAWLSLIRRAQIDPRLAEVLPIFRRIKERLLTTIKEQPEPANVLLAIDLANPSGHAHLDKHVARVPCHPLLIQLLRAAAHAHVAKAMRMVAPRQAWPYGRAATTLHYAPSPAFIARQETLQAEQARVIDQFLASLNAPERGLLERYSKGEALDLSETTLVAACARLLEHLVSHACFGHLPLR